ncbi:MAG: polysaccharide deacetylase, partial [Rhodoferax sp.]|nr:polysaccharide deacetylase [Rhodoferax sp.]
MNPAWQSFFDEIARWRESGRTVDFWWRDDDACRLDPALARLVALAGANEVSLALAVIPADLQAAAFEPADVWVTLLQHGVDHHNRAATGDKKTEFPASEEVSTALARLADGRQRLQRLTGSRVLPVLVPPWNRISAPHLISHLAGAGYRGLSTFGPRPSMYPAPGVLMVNTHV